MSAFSRKTALLLARAGALVLAIGMVSWFVWNAQARAQPTETPAGDVATPEGETSLSPAELAELMMHSSKSFSPTDIKIKDETAPTPDHVYLPSTKSLFVGDILPPIAGEGAKKKAAWLPSSKSLPPQEIPLPDSAKTGK